MRKNRKRILAFIMAMVMILGTFQTAFAAPADSAAREVEYEYEKLPQEPMAASATASSTEATTTYNEGPAAWAFDGDLTNAWHTVYDYANAPKPHWIQWELGGTYPVGRIEYQRKNTANNGNWRSITVEARVDGTWTQVFDGAVEDVATAINIDFPTVTADALKVTVKTATANGAVNDMFASAGEINVYKVTEIEKSDYTFTVSPATLTLNEGETYQLTSQLTPEAKDAVFGWDITNNNVVYSENGFIKAIGAGTATVRGTVTVDGVIYAEVCKVTVNKVERECRIALNGVDYTANSLQEAVAASGLPLKQVTSIEFKEGVIRKADFDYLKAGKNDIRTNLKTFIIGDEVELVGLANNAVPSNVFDAGTSAYSLEKVYLGNNVKGIEAKAFNICNKITSFQAPKAETIKGSALARMSSVEVFDFPMLKAIPDAMFGTMTMNAKEVSIPSVTQIQYNAFEKFSSLEKLTLGAVPPAMYPSGKKLTLAAGVAANLELVIPEGSLDAYKADGGYDEATNTWYGIALPEKAEETTVTFMDEGVEVGKITVEPGYALQVSDLPEVTDGSTYRKGWVGPNNAGKPQVSEELVKMYENITESITLETVKVATNDLWKIRYITDSNGYASKDELQTESKYYFENETAVLAEALPQRGEDNKAPGAWFVTWETTNSGLTLPNPGESFKVKGAKQTQINPRFGYYLRYMDGEETVLEKLLPVGSLYSNLDSCIPEDLEKEGQEFLGWQFKDNAPLKRADIKGSGAKINTTDRDITYQAVFERLGYVIKVDGVTQQISPYNTKVIVKAPAPEAGKKFAGWEVNGTIISKDETYVFYAANDINLIPTYVDDTEEIVKEEAKALLSNVIVEKRSDGKSDIKYVAQIVLPEGAELKEAGLVWKTTDTDYAEEVVIGADNVKVTKISKISNSYQFSVTIKGVPENKTVPGRIFATIDDTTVYSDTIGKGVTK